MALKAMIFRTRNRIAKLANPNHFVMGDHHFGFVCNYVYLGVTVDAIMSLVPVIKTLKKRISDKVFMFTRFESFSLLILLCSL